MRQPTMNTMPTYRQGRRVYRPGARGGESPIGSFCSVFFLIILICVVPTLLILSESNRFGTFMALSEAIGSDIASLHEQQKRQEIPYFAHGTSESIKTTVSDPDMGVTVPGALLLHRRTEYCQWQEIRREQCRQCSRTVKAGDGSTREETYDCDCVTYYDYIKTWRNHRINSMLFDQPAAHHNPQRDPMPSVKIPSTDAMLNFDIHQTESESEGIVGTQTVALDSSMLSSNNVRAARWRTVNWVLGGVPQSNPSFFTRFFAKWLPPDRTRYEEISELSGIDHSPAAKRDNFIYVGQGGYFFSPYESTTAASLFKYFMQYMEGTLFDWQLGDLMPSCTAGDVRFRYEVQDPAVVSVLGEVIAKKGKQLGVPILYPRKMTNGVSVGLVHTGYVSSDGMISAADSDSFWFAMIPRVLLLLWSIPLSRLVGAFVGKQVNLSSYPTQFASMCGVFFTVLGSVWAFYWGMTVDVTFAFFGGSMGFVFMASPRVPKSPSSGGLNATWCMIGRWANVPPSWRVEDSYKRGDDVGVEKPTEPVESYVNPDEKKQI
mmetsp:Transcript_17625/g.24289  ORF Transcript_17625/g.24289 Transcript_17625/m.24289 type:complete len:546 (-) Transcript_17625:100-1737(-)